MKDNLAQDLIGMIEDCKPLLKGQGGIVTDEDLLMNGVDETKLMTLLVTYIVDRDHTIWEHAYNLGQKRLRENAKAQIKMSKEIRQEYPGSEKAQDQK